MFNFIKRKLQKHQLKRTFQEYGAQVKTFQLPHDGAVHYAQWLHPFEGEKEINAQEVAFIRQFIQPGDLALDIGAHTGDTAVPMALACGKTGTLLALEPNPYVFKILQQNAALNPEKTNIVPLNFAATATDGPVVFHYSDASFCNGGDPGRINKKQHAYTLEVTGKNLLSYLQANYAHLLPRFTFLKVDAEGYDKEIVRSLQPLLAQFHPTILGECYHALSKEERTDYFNLLTGLGYQLYRLEGLFSHSMTKIETPAQMLDKKHFDFLAVVE
ncbi:FkbM family methyltransferase [Rufibacter sp. LB8]|uniref:FkbM family methyltransferase n=1 Tax=Rufibacter sp. LB8 TaxID=2777781 RepID=UPI00178C5AE3|nr:FkbM family methyltransferase [Rufibacter sp. LB8]